MGCKHAFPPGSVKTHQKKQHNLRVTKLDMDAIIEEYTITPAEKVQPPSSKVPFEGIEIENEALKCPVNGCNYVGLKLGTMNTHWSKKHNTESTWRYPSPKTRYFKVQAQTIFLASVRREYFEVDSKFGGDGAGNPFTLFTQQFQSSLNFTLPTPPPTKDRDIPVWVKKLGWYGHLQEFCDSDDEEKRTCLLEMAAAPKTGPLSQLSQVVEAYLKQVQAEESQVSRFILCSLMNYPM